MELMDQVQACVKWVKSLGRNEWTLADYPLRVFERSGLASVRRRKPFTWTAQVINWWHMRGDAFTREEALSALQRRFDAFRAASSLPRPGTGAPLKIEYARRDLVDSNSELVRDILLRVLGFNPNDCLVTDESSLWDFHGGESNDEYVRKIGLLYGVDVSGVDPPTLATIAERIREHRGV
jgi:hypothetical protein